MEIVAHVSHVLAVVNELQAPGVAGVEVLRTLGLGIDQMVHATEMLLGRVERVIVSPQRRRTTALVVHRAFPDLAHGTPQMLPSEMPKQERRVVIRIDPVREVTGEGAQLCVSGMDAARYL
jgi:hypothetical protein